MKKEKRNMNNKINTKQSMPYIFLIVLQIFSKIS